MSILDLMQASPGPSIDTAALLCATTAAHDRENEIPALLDIGGESVIAHQVQALRRFGIERFFIEVDQVSGSLLAVSDKIRQSGVSVEFVRSPQELAEKLSANAMLFTLAEGVVAEPKLLAEMMGNALPFIATVDGRDENSGFERMDLNTRWAGLARFNRGMIASVSDLPEGWSIASSLLRQGMQQGIARHALKQIYLQDHKLVLVAAPVDADHMTEKLLSARAAMADGAVESSIFGFFAKRLAPSIWRNDWARKAVPVMAMLTAAGSAAFAWSGMSGLGCVTALLSIFGLSIINTMTIGDNSDRLGRIIGPMIWALLGIALAAALWQGAATAIADLFPAVILVGLMVHAQQLKLPRWAGAILMSPALVLLLLLLFAIVDALPVGVRILSVLFVMTLTVSQFRRKTTFAKAGQA